MLTIVTKTLVFSVYRNRYFSLTCRFSLFNTNMEAAPFSRVLLHPSIVHFFLKSAVASTYLCDLFLFPTPRDEGSLMDVRIGGLLALKLACQEALLLRLVQEDSWNPSVLIS